MKRILRWFTLAWLLTHAVYSPAAPRDFTKETPAQRARRLEWFTEARFGMFIHWGLYALPAGEWGGKAAPSSGEWIMETMKIPIPDYTPLATRFNPTEFDARAWVRLAKEAGMKYIVITTKHHDGFGLWRSDLSDWNLKATPFPRDPLKELAAECRAAGLKLCFYHSIMDWHHPDYANRRLYHHLSEGQPEMDRYVAYLKGQLKELLTRYGPIGILWFDGEWEPAWTHERGVDLYNYVRTLQPDIIVNNRVGKARAGLNGMDQGEGVGDYGTPEQEIPATGFGPGAVWESCMTMNNTWGFRADDHDWKSSATLVRNLVDCASKGGNYLLNVGPTAEGLIPGPSVERLADLGRWMRVNHEAIYDTEASPFPRLGWGRCTRRVQGRKTTLFLHVFQWPKDGQLLVKGLETQPKRAYLLADKKRTALANVAGPDGLVITVPLPAPDAISTTVSLQFDRPLRIVEHGLRANADGSFQLPAAEANLQGGVRLQTHGDIEDLGYWTDPADTVAWALTVPRPRRYEVRGSFAALTKSTLELQVGEETVRVNIPPTGEWGKFHEVVLGEIDLPAGDNAQIKLQPVAEGWQPVNVRGLMLTPK